MTNQILNPKSKINKKNHHRFLVKPENLREDFFESKDHNLINQIKNVFRLSAGDQITVFDGSGNEYIVEVEKIEKTLILGKVLGKKNDVKNKSKINLFCSLLKGDHFEIVLEKCTELGIDYFYPVVFDHSIIREVKPNRLGRYKKIIKEAAEQSGRMNVPEVFEPISFTESVKKTKSGLNLVAAIGADENILDINFKNKNTNIFIGPEGDFSERELETMEKEGFLFFNLGKNVLRSETAAMVSCGIVVQNML